MAYDSDLTPLFKKCTDEDLDTIVQYIIKEGGFTEDISSSNEYKLYAPKHTKYIDLIVDEIQRYGGDSFVNIFRGGGVRYREIVEDVADKLSVKYNNNMSISDIEELIIAHLIEKAWGKMTEEERIEFLKDANVDINKLDGKQKGVLLKGNFDLLKTVAIGVPFLQLLIKVTGFKAYQIAVIVANIVSKAILGHGLALASNAALMRGMAIFAGPVGWILGGILMVPLFSGAAYRVTTPCVVHIAMLRMKYMNDLDL